MLPLHTQKSLDALTWNEIQKLHTSLGLKATATTRSRRDYQRRILATQPQPVAEPEHIASPLTCAICPLARLIDGNRYCCGLTNNVTRGHWEAQTDCYDAVAEVQTEATEPATEPEAPIVEEIPALGGFYNPPVVNRDGDNYKIISGNFQYHAAPLPHPKIDDGFMAAMVRESDSDRDFYNLAYLWQCEMEAQLAVEAAEIGSEQEAVAYSKLREIERKIKTYGMHECNNCCKVPEVETLSEGQIPATATVQVMTEVQAIGVSAMNESNDAIARALPYPQPKFWFGDRVSFSCSWSSPEDVIECYWSEGIVTGMNWNPESEEWKYLIYWEESSEDFLPGYDNDRLLMPERDLVACA